MTKQKQTFTFSVFRDRVVSEALIVSSVDLVGGDPLVGKVDAVDEVEAWGMIRGLLELGMKPQWYKTATEYDKLEIKIKPSV